MKYLIPLFVFLSFACSGQDKKFLKQFPSINPKDTLPYEILSKSDEIVITVEMLLNYTLYCYNDSTERIAIGKNGGIYYIHRKPTFENFIEWLRKK